VLPRLRESGFDWLVPAFREELVTALVRSLPKDARRRLVPVPQVAAEVTAALRPRKGRFADQVAAELGRLRGVRVTAADFDESRLPAHLRMTFRVEDENGAVVAEGTDLGALRERVRPRLRAELATSTEGPHEARLLRLDNAKAGTRMGWRPALSLDETVDFTVEWYRAVHENPRVARPMMLDQLHEYARRVSGAGITG
jgi:nucleoside-diphosphate-sugar epimerase